MKSSVLGILFAGAMALTAGSLGAQDAVKPSLGTVVADKIVMYIPNRVMDLLDIVSFELGTGANAKAGVRLTHAFGLGGSIGNSGNFVKGFNRAIGFSLDKESQIYALAMGSGDLMRDCVYGNLAEYWFSYSGMQMPSDPVFRDKAMDYWAIEVKAALLAGAGVGIHPLSIADFFCGIFCYDLLDNDYKLIAD